MLEVGKRQVVEYVKKTDFGIYLADLEDKEDTVLLPKKEVLESLEIGDELEVFIYRDSKDRLISTTRSPKFFLGEICELEVVAVTSIGAFVDWGLEKDLLIPFKEQKKRLKIGDKYLFGLYIDKSDRLCGTMNLYEFLKTDHTYEKEAQVEGILYDLNPQFGAFIAIDNKYHGLIQKKDVYGDLKIGDKISARVVQVREDGKLVLNLKQKAFLAIDEDAKMLLQVLEDNGGYVDFNDRTDPEVIKNELQMSKRAFKRAVGNLLKSKQIAFKGSGIELKVK